MATQIATRDGRVLPYADLVRESPSDFRVRMEIYTDPLIFQEEMRAIFERVWVYVAHESEVQQRGDYKTATIGRQPVIVVRGEDDRIRVLLNACRHRGASVCREQLGNTSAFRCPYHGWVYDNTGKLIGVSQRFRYPEGFDEAIDGLIAVPRVAVYRGLIFASLNERVESLEDHLGWVRKYVDLWVDMAPTGEIRLHRPHAYDYQGNWKFQAENGADGYHPRFLHDSAFKTLDHFGVRNLKESAVRMEVGLTRGGDRGHGILELGPIGGMGAQNFQTFKDTLADVYGPDRAEEAAIRRHILIFPNVYLMDANLRVFEPVSPEHTIVYSHFTDLVGMPEAVNRARMHDLERRLGTAGFIGMDDIEVFAAAQTGMRATAMESIVLSRGMGMEELQADGEQVGHYTDEVPQRSFYREWLRRITAA